MTVKTPEALAAWEIAEDNFWGHQPPEVPSKGSGGLRPRYRGKYKKMTKELRAKALQLLAAGNSVRVVGKMLDLPKSSISRLKNQ